MTLVDEFLRYLFSFNFYIFLWILLVILTYFLLRRLLSDYKHERMVENSRKLLESESSSMRLSEIQFYLERDNNLLEERFKKGTTELKDDSAKNSLLFRRMFSLTNSQTPKREFVFLLASEMNKVRKRKEFLTDSLSSELSTFIDNPEDWVERFIIFTPDKSQQIAQNLKVRELLHEYLREFIEVMQIPELKFFPLFRQS